MIFAFKLGCLITFGLVAALMLINLAFRRYEIISWRNVFLGGFVFFYASGGYLTIDYLTASDSAVSTLALLMPMFVVVTALSSAIGVRFSIVKRIPELGPIATNGGLLLTIAIGCALGLLSAAVTAVGYFSALATQFKEGFAITATGLAAYYVICRRFNPAAIAVFVGALGVAVLVSTVGTIGRRGILAAFFAIGWMWWYAWMRYRPISSTVIRGAIVAFASFLFVVAYSGVRISAGEREGATLQGRFQTMQKLITNPKIERRIIEEMLRQDAPDQTLFIIDNYGKSFPHIPLHGAHYFLVNPIPRFLYTNKPVGLGLTLQEQRDAPANLGPGIIGHGWAEASFIGVFYYAIFFGIITGVVDRWARERANDPYTLAVLGVSLGNVFALSRGETSLFFIHVVTSASAGGFMIVMLRIIAGPVMRLGNPIYPQIQAPEEVDYVEGEYVEAEDAYADYGAEDAQTKPETD